MVHPSKRIIVNDGPLSGKSVVLGVTASISLYKSLDLARELMRHGSEVHVIMSRAASRLISPSMFEWATGNPVTVDITGNLEHVQLSEKEAMVVAPATMNFLNKLAYGITDNSVLLTASNFIGEHKPLFIVPTMHLSMYKTTQVLHSLEMLKSQGIHVIEPYEERDVAHYPDINLLTWQIESIILRGKDLSGKKILVTAGPTREYMDPVRFMSNPSSGTMGIAIANEAFFRGAEVRLIHGPLSTSMKPAMKNVFEVKTTDEMMKEVEAGVKEGFSIVILAGAPADFSFQNKFENKVDTAREVPEVKLIKTPKVSSVAVGKAFVVGFSAETVDNDEELTKKARAKMERHGFNMIVTNNVSRHDIGFGSTDNEIFIITNESQMKISKNNKIVIARGILDNVKKELELQRRRV